MVLAQGVRVYYEAPLARIWRRLGYSSPSLRFYRAFYQVIWQSSRQRDGRGKNRLRPSIYQDTKDKPTDEAEIGLDWNKLSDCRISAYYNKKEKCYESARVCTPYLTSVTEFDALSKKGENIPFICEYCELNEYARWKVIMMMNACVP